jgi:hypothetical protein
MKFKVDENLPAGIAEDLRAAGHEAVTVVDQGLAGAPDSVLLATIQSEARALFTMDKGIADIRVYPPHHFAGIVLFRPRTTARAAVLACVRYHLPSLLGIDLNGRLVIVSEVGIRIR